MARRLFLTASLALAACDNPPSKTYGPVVEGGADGASAADAGDASAPPEAGTDAGDGGGCAGLTALLAGGGSSLVGASRAGSGAFKVDVLTGGAADRLAVVAFGAGFLGALRAPNDAIQSTVFAASWADPAVVASAVTRDAPALAVSGNAAHLVYQAKSADAMVDYKYFHGTFTSGSWDAANDPVGGSGPSQSYGPRGPAAAVASMQLVVAQAGDDSKLYDQTLAGTWQAAVQHAGATIQKTIPPAMIAMTGGSAELLAVYARDADYKIMSTARSSGTWSTPALVDANAFLSGSTNEPVALAPLAGGKAVMVYRGTDSKAYFSRFDPAQSPAWTAPAPLVSGTNPAVASLPSVATGVCGADAVAAYVETGVGAKVVTLAGSAWSAPDAVPQTSAAQFVGVATRP